MDAVVWIVKDRIAVYANLVIRYNLFLFPTESDSREECVLVNVSSDLVENLVSHDYYGLLSVFIRAEEWNHLIA